MIIDIGWFQMKLYTRVLEASRVSFHINAEALPTPEAFPCLGRTITYNNRDLTEAYQNLRKARRPWGMVVRVL